MNIEEVINAILPITAFDAACTKRLAVKEEARKKAEMLIVNLIENALTEALIVNINENMGLLDETFPDPLTGKPIPTFPKGGEIKQRPIAMIGDTGKPDLIPQHIIDQISKRND